MPISPKIKEPAISKKASSLLRFLSRKRTGYGAAPREKAVPYVKAAGDKPPPYDGSGVREKKQPYAKIIFHKFSSSALYLSYAYFPKNKRTRYIKKSKFFAPLSFKKADGARGSAPGIESGRGYGAAPRNEHGVRGGAPGTSRPGNIYVCILTMHHKCPSAWPS